MNNLLIIISQFSEEIKNRHQFKTNQPNPKTSLRHLSFTRQPQRKASQSHNNRAGSKAPSTVNRTDELSTGVQHRVQITDISVRLFWSIRTMEKLSTFLSISLLEKPPTRRWKTLSTLCSPKILSQLLCVCLCVTKIKPRLNALSERTDRFAYGFLIESPLLVVTELVVWAGWCPKLAFV